MAFFHGLCNNCAGNDEIFRILHAIQANEYVEDMVADDIFAFLIKKKTSLFLLAGFDLNRNLV